VAEAAQDALSDEAMKFGIDPPRGVLMLGVQGAGKSLAAKAVATAWQRPLLAYGRRRAVRQIHRRIRTSPARCAATGRAHEPIILWIDEIEKAFASPPRKAATAG
jgi:ATP-dependent 26S proteasome regulatory subunit